MENNIPKGGGAVPVALRLAGVQDAPALLEIYTPHILHTTASWEYEPPTLQEFEQRICTVLRSGFPWLVAQQGSTIVGYAYASRYGARKGYDFSAESTIYLAPQAAGQGTGRLLYTALLALLKAQGYCSVFARITHPNPASEAFHTAMGFVQESCFANTGYKNGQWLGLAHYRIFVNPCTQAPQPPRPLDALAPSLVAACLQPAPHPAA